ncbi:hypothetical protein U9W50_000219 [Staphylococcus pseudintermedius]|nr:hypothetical protein [Staphylococcus pseudintermedius]
MRRFREFKDYDMCDLSAEEQLEEFVKIYPSTKVVGYSNSVFWNANNKERAYILVEYWEDKQNDGTT